MEVLKKLAHMLGIIISMVVIDQYSKLYLQSHIAEKTHLSFASGKLLLIPTYNKGAFLSLGQSLDPALKTTFLMYGVSLFLLLLFIYVLSAYKVKPADTTAFSFIIAGGLSNLFDRFLYQGQVFDFLFMKLGSLHTGIFNLADVALMFGVILFVINRFRK